MSLKTIATKFPKGSMEYIYLHGTWQKSRGRNPSIIAGNHKTPEETFESAKDCVGEYIELIRRQPFSRHWIWHESLVAAVQNKLPAEEVAKLESELFWRVEACE